MFNRRIAKSVDSDGAGVATAEIERYVLDGDHIALTFDEAGNLVERFLHGTEIDQVIAQENGNGDVNWALTDNQGSIRFVLDSVGNIVNQITYDAFGNVTLESDSSVEFRFGYTGRELDDETGQYFYRARYYDATVGRFIGEDPIEFSAGDTNLSRYVNNSPTNAINPSGLEALVAPPPTPTPTPITPPPSTPVITPPTPPTPPPATGTGLGLGARLLLALPVAGAIVLLWQTPTAKTGLDEMEEPPHPNPDPKKDCDENPCPTRILYRGTRRTFEYFYYFLSNGRYIF